MGESAIGWKNDDERKAWDAVDAKAKALSAKCDERIAEGSRVEAARHIIEIVGTMIQGLELLMMSVAPDTTAVRLTLRAIENSLLLLDNTLQQI